MHGLKSFGGVKLDLHYQQFEKDMLSDWFKKNQDVSFVSTGSKYKILQHLKVSNEKNFCTIPNFTDISNIGLDTSVDIRKKYCIPDDGFIILYIGLSDWSLSLYNFKYTYPLSDKLSSLFALISQIISTCLMALNAISRWWLPNYVINSNLNPKLLNVLAYFTWMLQATLRC